MSKNTLLYAGLIIFGLAGAFIFPAYKLQLSFLYIVIDSGLTKVPQKIDEQNPAIAR